MTRVYVGVADVLYAGIVDPRSVDGDFPRIRRCMGTEDLCIVDRHDPRIRRCCGMQPRSTIATVSTAYTHVYAGVWGARIPALSTAITHIYAGVADVLYAGIEDPHITAITRVYAGVGTGCGD